MQPNTFKGLIFLAVFLTAETTAGNDFFKKLEALLSGRRGPQSSVSQSVKDQQRLPPGFSKNRFDGQQLKQDMGEGAAHEQRLPPDLPKNKVDEQVANQDCFTVPSFPGIDYSLMGYNILYGYPMEIGMDPGFRNPIFARNFDDLNYTPDCKYAVPDGLYLFNALSCITTCSADESKSEEEFTSSLEAEATAKGGIWGVSFSASASYKTAVQEISMEHTTYIFSTALCKYYFSRMDTVYPPPLHSSFIAKVQTLDDTDDKVQYFNFFDMYGTHYVLDTDYGARFTQQYMLTEEQYSIAEQSSYSVSTQAEYAGTFSISGGAGMTSEETEAAQEFSKHSSETTITVGALPTSGDVNAWASTVSDQPMPMRYSLGSIEYVFTADFFKDHQDVDYNRIRQNILKYKPDYCQYLLDQGLVEYCEEPVPVVNCDLYKNGPHDIRCLRTWWINAGCSSHGDASPDNSQSNVDWWNTLDGRTVRQNMWSYRNNANNDYQFSYIECFGTTDDCPLNSPGPHEQNCLDTWWENAGCFMKGQGSPTNKGPGWWNTQSGTTVRSDMRSYREHADRGEENYYRWCIGYNEDCDLTGPGPHGRDCLNQWWLEAGCLSQGAASPDNSQIGFNWWNDQYATEVRVDMHYHNLYAKQDKSGGYYDGCFGHVAGP